MESRPSKVGQDRDRISALPDDLLLGILERLSLHEAVRAGAVSTRWRHLPHQLSRVDLDVDDFQGRAPLESMDAFAGAVCRLLDCKCDCNSRRSVKTLGLRFHLSAPNLSSIGRAVEDTVSRGQTECLEFDVIPPTSDSDLTAVGRTELGQQFMSFSHACPIAFRWLTDLWLTSLDLGDADLPSLMGACDKLQHLSLTSCRFGWHSALEIDVPNSAIQSLEFVRCSCMRIELVSLPKLTHLMCESWNSENAPLRLSYVPQLRSVILCSHAGVGQAPFALSECLTTDVTSLSQLHLNFSCQMIWIKPEHPKLLTPIFRNLKDLWLWHIFPECDLNWTLFILEAAPALQMFILSRARHSCVKTSEFSAEKANVVWEPSKDLKHLNLRLLVMIGFEEEDKATNYIRFVMERAVGLRGIMLCGSKTCEACDAIDLESPTRYEADKACRRRIKERLTHGSSSSVKIINCDRDGNELVISNLIDEVLKGHSCWWSDSV
ncbi:uncharacterized protein LOC124659967 [Lolium rigidum]|uniref:uncharacterized protein LOC124659967 n=1 Tax=Lolium rigidum TaxID=89674 RepID=UPI001F5C7B19|nr:uncharacterized protein LOC124659967 [Lolium rigidum]